MAKGIYLGIDSLSRKVKKMYLGIEGVARKVKKGYVGVAGVARLFFSGGGIPSFLGRFEPTFDHHNYAAVAGTKDYLLISGGADYDVKPYNVVSVFNDEYTEENQLQISTGTQNQLGATFKEKAYFIGGSIRPISQSGATKSAYCFSNDLTLTNFKLLYSVEKSGVATTSSKCVLAGGENAGGDLMDVSAFDEDQTTIQASSGLRLPVTLPAGAGTEDNAIFIGGIWSSRAQTDRTAYDNNLTKTQLDSSILLYGRLSGCKTGRYALFGGGSDRSDETDRVEAYDNELSITVLSPLDQARYNAVAFNIGEFGLFAGGNAINSTVNAVDCYDGNLEKTVVPTEFSAATPEKLNWRGGASENIGAIYGGSVMYGWKLT